MKQPTNHFCFSMVAIGFNLKTAVPSYNGSSLDKASSSYLCTNFTFKAGVKEDVFQSSTNCERRARSEKGY